MAIQVFKTGQVWNEQSQGVWSLLKLNEVIEEELSFEWGAQSRIPIVHLLSTTLSGLSRLSVLRPSDAADSQTVVGPRIARVFRLPFYSKVQFLNSSVKLRRDNTTASNSVQTIQIFLVKLLRAGSNTGRQREIIFFVYISINLC